MKPKPPYRAEARKFPCPPRVFMVWYLIFTGPILLPIFPAGYSSSCGLSQMQSYYNTSLLLAAHVLRVHICHGTPSPPSTRVLPRTITYRAVSPRWSEGRETELLCTAHICLRTFLYLPALLLFLFSKSELYELQYT